ncbi:MAG: hypothetical protein ACXVXY_10115 [Mycobacteriaceae bacterium]
MRESHWRGQSGRLEVWYTSLTDPATGTGFWLHTELVAPTSGELAYVHGWAAIFPPDAPPVWERFGPTPAEGALPPSELAGTAGVLSWQLRQVATGGRPLYTFPRYAWEHELLPAAQVVLAPAALYDGTFTAGDRVFSLRGARGASSRIYGHGSARRWGWLHADLGDGDVLELVAAVSTRPGLSALPPLTFLQLRLDGHDLPRDPLLTAPLLRAKLGLPEWRVGGLIDVVGRRRITVHVRQDPERSVAVGYTDPDGATATCHNSEVASADVRLDRLGHGGWRVEREWHLDRSAHAEIGLRP